MAANRLNSYVERNFATYKGLARAALGELEYLAGSADRYLAADLSPGKRLVFVCLGNINRSPFAEAVGRDIGLNCTSFGLSTQSGNSAFGRARKIAGEMGYSLEDHLTTDSADFTPLTSDIYFVMETRHARELVRRGYAARQIALLGYWSRPQRLHIQDPHEHGEDYFRTCFSIIQSAVRNLALAVKHRNPSRNDIAA